MFVEDNRMHFFSKIVFLKNLNFKAGDQCFDLYSLSSKSGLRIFHNFEMVVEDSRIDCVSIFFLRKSLVSKEDVFFAF